jgi:hypothetical protein
MEEFNKLVKLIIEDNVSGDGGVFGGGDSFGYGGAIGNKDFWNTGDARIPYVLGYFTRNGRLKPKRSKRKRKNVKKRKKTRKN